MPISDDTFRRFQEAVANYLMDLDARLTEVESKSRVTAPRETKELRAALQLASGDIGALKLASDATNSAVRAVKDGFEHAVTGNAALKTLIDRESLALGAVGDKLDKLQASFNRSQKDELFLSNIAYGYALMAMQWKISREHVRAVVAVPTTAQFLIAISAKSLGFALKVGLSMATGGLGTAFFNAFAEPLAEMMKEMPGMAASFGSSEGYNDIAKDVAKDAFMPAVGSAFDQTTGRATESIQGGFGRVLDPGGAAAEAADALVDPYEFFLECETKLRLTAVQLANARTLDADNAAHRAGLTSGFGTAKDGMSLDALAGDPFWGFLFVPMSAAESAERWEVVTSVLGAQMRRMAWRMYCRSQWSNATFDYTVKPKSSFSEAAEPAGFQPLAPPAAVWSNASWKDVGNAADLHYKAWDSNKGWPAHWGEICADFRGPEHIPGHRLNSTPEAVRLATLAQARMTWISQAVVQCCQVKIDLSVVKSITIDLEMNVSFSDGSGAVDEATKNSLVGLRFAASPKDLLFAADKSALESTYKAISAAGVERVGIAEVRFGKSKKGTLGVGTVTGKKGILSAPNSETDPLRPALPGSLRASITLTSSSLTSRSAYVYLIKGAVARDADGKPTGAAPASQLIGDTAFRSSHSHTLNIDLPTSGPGTYCITLDGRRPLRGSERKFFSEATWYFDILA